MVAAFPGTKPSGPKPVLGSGKVMAALKTPPNGPDRLTMLTVGAVPSNVMEYAGGAVFPMPNISAVLCAGTSTVTAPSATDAIATVAIESLVLKLVMVPLPTTRSDCSSPATASEKNILTGMGVAPVGRGDHERRCDIKGSDYKWAWRRACIFRPVNKQATVDGDLDRVAAGRAECDAKGQTGPVGGNDIAM